MQLLHELKTADVVGAFCEHGMPAKLLQIRYLAGMKAQQQQLLIRHASSSMSMTRTIVIVNLSLNRE